jgi:hypothetical protein
MGLTSAGSFSLHVGARSTSAMMKRIFRGVILLVLAGLTMSAQAIGDQIRFSQAASGAISAVLAGSVDPCQGSNQFPFGPSTVSLNGNEYDINTFFIILDPPPCPDIPAPYEVTASLGIAGDGHYTVVWTVGALNVLGTFDVRSGILQLTPNTVPVLTSPWLSILFAMIALTGLALLRRQQ